MVESVTDYAIVMLDPEGLAASWNAGAERIKGYSAEEIVGQHFSRFYLQEDIQSGKPQRDLDLVAAKGQFEDEGWRVRQGRFNFHGLGQIPGQFRKAAQMAALIPDRREDHVGPEG